MDRNPQHNNLTSSGLLLNQTPAAAAPTAMITKSTPSHLSEFLGLTTPEQLSDESPSMPLEDWNLGSSLSQMNNNNNNNPVITSIIDLREDDSPYNNNQLTHTVSQQNQQMIYYSMGGNNTTAHQIPKTNPRQHPIDIQKQQSLTQKLSQLIHESDCSSRTNQHTNSDYINLSQYYPESARNHYVVGSKYNLINQKGEELNTSQLIKGSPKNAKIPFPQGNSTGAFGEKKYSQPSLQSKQNSASFTQSGQKPNSSTAQKPQKQSTSFLSSSNQKQDSSRMQKSTGRIQNPNPTSTKGAGFLESAARKFGAPVSKIDLGQLERDWKEIQSFLSHWNINLQTKPTYLKSDLIELVKSIETKIVTQLDRQVMIERNKNRDQKSETRFLNKQLQIHVNQVKELQQNQVPLAAAATSNFKEEEILRKIEECQQELKQTMLNSLMCLDFYKDLDSYICDKRFSIQTSEAQIHINFIDQLIHQHQLNQLDFDTDRIQQLLESIHELLRDKKIEQKTVKISIAGHSQEPLQIKESPKNTAAFNIKVTKLQKNTTNHPFSMKIVPTLSIGTLTVNPLSQTPTAHDPHSSSRSTSSKPDRPAFTVPIKSESHHDDLKVKIAIIARQREQLEHMMKQNLELKQQLRNKDDERFQAGQTAQFKEALVKLENNHNEVVKRCHQLQIENGMIKTENEKAVRERARIANAFKEVEKDKLEMRRVLEGVEGFKKLEEAVYQMSAIMVSKKNEQMTAQQIQQLKSIFGNSAILQQLRNIILNNERIICKFTHFLTQSIKLNMQQQDLVKFFWSIIKQTSNIVLKIDSQDLNQNESLLLVQSIFQKHWKSVDLLSHYQFKEIESRANFLSKLRDEIAKEQDILFQQSSEQDKIAILQMSKDTLGRKPSVGRTISFDEKNSIPRMSSQSNQTIGEYSILSLRNQSRKDSERIDEVRTQTKQLNLSSTRTGDGKFYRQNTEEKHQEILDAEFDFDLLKDDPILDIFEEMKNDSISNFNKEKRGRNDNKRSELDLYRITETQNQSYSQPPRLPLQGDIHRGERKTYEEQAFQDDDLISKISRAEISDVTSITRGACSKGDALSGVVTLPKTSKKILREKLRRLKQRNVELVNGMRELQLKLDQLEGVQNDKNQINGRSLQDDRYHFFKIDDQATNQNEINFTNVNKYNWMRNREGLQINLSDNSEYQLMIDMIMAQAETIEDMIKKSRTK